MAVKKILIEPNKILRQVSQPVNEVNKEIQKLLDDMLETMYSANGIGLAAIQIGIPKNLIVIDLLTKEKKKDPMYFINPKIIKQSEKLSKYEEGCLSIPNLFAEQKGVVAEGFLKDRFFLEASKILAKHDENYMPPEVKEALKEK